jgi:hypothetical protein
VSPLDKMIFTNIGSILPEEYPFTPLSPGKISESAQVGKQ